MPGSNPTTVTACCVVSVTSSGMLFVYEVTPKSTLDDDSWFVAHVTTADVCVMPEVPTEEICAVLFSTVTEAGAEVVALPLASQPTTVTL